MRCEIIAVGTELLLGQIVDTNSSWMGEQLALAGIDSHYQTKVGDNLARMVASIRLALERSDAVITCGGLGPTQDDITREAIAEVMGVALHHDAEVAERIRAMFTSRRRPMAANNLRQAEVPEGAKVIAQMPGTAPGLICPVGDKVVYAVPGVPHEMREMLEGSVLPDLQRRSGVTAVIRSRVLRTWGETESGLAERLAGRIAELDVRGNPTLAFQASGIEGIKVRITAKADDADAAEAMLAAEEAELKPLLGGIVFGVDDDTMESVVLAQLRRQGLSLAVAEPLTGGLLASRMSVLPQAGAVFAGAVVPQSADAWRTLGVAPDASADAGCAMAMADGVRKLLGADVGLAALDGAAGDDAAMPARGTVLLGLALGDTADCETVRLPGDRHRLRQYAVISLLNALRHRLG